MHRLSFRVFVFGAALCGGFLSASRPAAQEAAPGGHWPQWRGPGATGVVWKNCRDR
jgi:hypothetical protein